MYKFRLTVADGKGLKGNDDVILTIKEGMWLISMHLKKLTKKACLVLFFPMYERTNDFDNLV